MLAKCTAESLSFWERLGLLSQETVENDARAVYLDTKRLLHRAALRAYGCNACRSSCSSILMGTKRIRGRCTASAIASVSM